MSVPPIHTIQPDVSSNSNTPRQPTHNYQWNPTSHSSVPIQIQICGEGIISSSTFLRTSSRAYHQTRLTLLTQPFGSTQSIHIHHLNTPSHDNVPTHSQPCGQGNVSTRSMSRSFESAQRFIQPTQPIQANEAGQSGTSASSNMPSHAAPSGQGNVSITSVSVHKTELTTVSSLLRPFDLTKPVHRAHQPAATC